MNPKEIRRRAGKAWQDHAKWEHLWREANNYITPYRSSGAVKGDGADLLDEVYDSTAIDAAFRFSGRMQQQLTPPFQKFFSLGSGPLVEMMGEQKKKEAEELLAKVTALAHGALQTSDFHLAAPEMYLDLFVGTGALLMLESEDPNNVMEVMSVPIQEIALEAGPFNRIWGRHWRRNFQASHLETLWPRGEFSDRLQQLMKSEQDAPIEITQSTVWNPKTKRHELMVLAGAQGAPGAAATAAKVDDEPPIHTASSVTSPWATPRFFVVPGEPYGRGPGLIALPSIRTANKVVEFDLKAAAFALFGLWTATDDGVINPDSLRFEPGAIWNVRSNGGSRGPSLQRLDVPGSYDLSRFILEEQRSQINQMTFNRRLPPETGAVRSPTEILERVRDLDFDMSGVFGRLALEIIQPVVQRTIEILYNKRIVQFPVEIDQFITKLQVVSPIAQAQAAEAAKKIVDYATLVIQLKGPQYLPVFLREEDAILELGRSIGVPEDKLPGPAERKQMMAAIEERARAEMAAKVKPEPVPEPKPNQQGGV